MGRTVSNYNAREWIENIHENVFKPALAIEIIKVYNKQQLHYGFL